MDILKKYNLLSANLRQSSRTSKEISTHSRKLAEEVQLSILQSLISTAETPKPSASIFSRVQNVIVGDNALAVQAALEQAQKEGFYTESLGSAWQGEAREVGVELAQRLRVTSKQQARPFCLIAGVETTVTLGEVSSLRLHSPLIPDRTRPQGSGGRNQELALAAVSAMAELENVMLISLATDGEDGPTDAAGAVVNAETLQRARSLGLDPGEFLARNDSYTFFDALWDLLKIGPTGTNVNDLTFLFAY